MTERFKNFYTESEIEFFAEMKSFLPQKKVIYLTIIFKKVPKVNSKELLRKKYVGLHVPISNQHLLRFPRIFIV